MALHAEPAVAVLPATREHPAKHVPNQRVRAPRRDRRSVRDSRHLVRMLRVGKNGLEAGYRVRKVLWMRAAMAKGAKLSEPPRQ